LETGKDTLLLMGGWSPDGQLVAAGDYEGTVYFWEASSGELLRTLTCLSWGHIVQWSPDGSKIAMLCFDWDNNLMAIQVVDAETYQTLLYFDVDLMRTVPMVRWSPDSTRLVIGGGSDEMGLVTNPVYVYDASSGEELLNVFGHTSRFLESGWSPDGKRIVSGSTDDTTRIWDAQTGAELLTLPTPGDWYVIPDWSPDGKYLLVSFKFIQPRAIWRVARLADHPGADRLCQRVLRYPRADRGRAGAVWVEVGFVAMELRDLSTGSEIFYSRKVGALLIFVQVFR
jgi:WD40 repeat protein